MTRDQKDSGRDKPTVCQAGLLALALMFSGLIFTFDILTPLGVAAGTPYVLVVLLGSRLPRTRCVAVLALLCTLLTLAGAYLSPPGQVALWKALLNRGLAITTIWLIAYFTWERRILETRREQAVQERERAVSEVKTLRGLLPICAGCKKIRDENGLWRPVESYIHEHSEADFSHGLCPECMEKIYPGYHI